METERRKRTEKHEGRESERGREEEQKEGEGKRKIKRYKKKKTGVSEGGREHRTPRFLFLRFYKHGCSQREKRRVEVFMLNTNTL